MVSRVLCAGEECGHTDGGANIEAVFEVDDDGIPFVDLYKRTRELPVYYSHSTGESIGCC